MRIIVDPDGFVVFKAQRYKCALGRAGVGLKHREGDGITPIGQYALGRVFWRPDRLPTPPVTGLEVVDLKPYMGWCDDPGHEDYNHLITLPHPGSHEILWRDDALYDIVVEIEYNANPVEPGKGSAIFIHVAKPDYSPTEGCIALDRDHLLALLRESNDETTVVISES